jgi:DNA-binding NarL/FixJ family response regulator
MDASFPTPGELNPLPSTHAFECKAILNFLLVDDHTIVRSALKGLCLELYPGSVFHESSDAIGIMELYAVNRYDLVIADIQIANSDMLWLIRSICNTYPQASILVYSMTAENIYAVRVLKAGAKGFISKEAPLEELISAIKLTLQGKPYISQFVAGMLGDQSFPKSDTPFTILSRRELQIASLLLSGQTVTAISKLLNIGSSTVGTHKGKIYQKLHVKNLIELKTIADIYKFNAA